METIEHNGTEEFWRYRNLSLRNSASIGRIGGTDVYLLKEPTVKRPNLTLHPSKHWNLVFKVPVPMLVDKAFQKRRIFC